MGVFRQIPDEIYKEAGEVIRYASGQSKQPPVTEIPEITMIVAGAAVAMEKAGFQGPYTSRDVTAKEWLKEGSQPWRYLHGAVSQILDPEYRKQAEIPMDNRSLLKHIVSDTVYRSEAMKVDMLVKFPIAEDKDQQNVSYYPWNGKQHNHPEVELAERKRDMMGSYYQLSELEQKNLSEKFLYEPTNHRLEQAIHVASLLISENAQQRGENFRQADRQLADFDDYGTPLFAKQTDEIKDNLHDLAQGRIKPVTTAQAVVVSYAQNYVSSEENQTYRHERYVENAMGQFLADHDTSEMTKPVNAIQGAEKIENYVMALQQSEKDFYEMNKNPLADIHLISEPLSDLSGNLDKEEQKALFNLVEKGELGAPLDIMKIAVGAFEIESDQSLGIKKDNSITYENVKPEDINNIFIDDFYRPGDKVRLADNNLGKELESKFLDDVFTIQKTVVVGELESDGIGGQRTVVKPLYEFEGHMGRYSAVAFQHERGDEHTLAVVMEKNDRLWMVPVEEKSSGQEDKVDGFVFEYHKAREVQETDFPKSMEGYDFTQMKENAKEAMLGEFSYRPLDGYKDINGPVEITYIPWNSQASDSERDKAALMIDAKIATEGQDQSRSELFRQMSHGMSR